MHAVFQGIRLPQRLLDVTMERSHARNRLGLPLVPNVESKRRASSSDISSHARSTHSE
jgi:hypothetical protein